MLSHILSPMDNSYITINVLAFRANGPLTDEFTSGVLLLNMVMVVFFCFVSHCDLAQIKRTIGVFIVLNSCKIWWWWQSF